MARVTQRLQIRIVEELLKIAQMRFDVIHLGRKNGFTSPGMVQAKRVASQFPPPQLLPFLQTVQPTVNGPLPGPL